MNTGKTGKSGEEYASAFLQRMGFEIVCQNYHSRFGEIDIIAEDSQYIVFVEVKTRKSNTMVSPAEAVSKAKQTRIIKTASMYLKEHTSVLQPRFDVIEVTCFKDGTQQINQIENAFCLEAGYGIF